MSYPEQPSAETLARFRELLVDTLHRQLGTADALESKAWQAVGVGSIVLGLGIAGDLDGWELVFPLVGYVVLVGGAFQCIRIRGWSVPPVGDELWRDGWFLEAHDVDHTIVKALAEGEPANRGLLATKAHATRFALVGLGVEIVALVVAAIAG
jgi:hypothetical protein